MNSKLWVGVYRRLDNRAEGLSDDSPRAVELHNRRKKALHDALEDGNDRRERFGRNPHTGWLSTVGGRAALYSHYLRLTQIWQQRALRGRETFTVYFPNRLMCSD